MSLASTALLLLLSVGCRGAGTPVEPDPGGERVVANVEVAPDSTRVPVDSTVRLSATVEDSSGQTLDRSVTWSSMNSTVVTVDSTGTASGQAEGNAGVVAEEEGVADTTRIAVTSLSDTSGTDASSVIEPELPSETIRWTPPEVTGQTIRVEAGDDLQAAIDRAEPGDEILVASDWSQEGPFVMPSRSDDGWITIRGDVTLPAFGERVSKAQADAMPTVTITSQGHSGMRFPSDTEGWWITGIQIQADGVASSNDGFRMEGAERIAIDRSAVVVSGDNSSQLRDGAQINGGPIMVIGSRIEGLKVDGNESHGVVGWTGPGPWRVYNNFIEAASIGFLAGGADPATDENGDPVHPADLEFTNNHVYKRPSWFSSNLSLAVKNGFELKNMKRALVKGNIIENTWADGQSGFIVLIKSVEQGGAGCPTCGTQDVTFRLNKVINGTKGFNLARSPEGDPVPLQRVMIEDVIVEKWGDDSDWDQSGTKRLLQVLGQVDGLIFRRITALNSAENGTILENQMDSNSTRASGFEFVEVVTGPTAYGIRPDPLDDGYEESSRVFGANYTVLRETGANCPKDQPVPADPDWNASYNCPDAVSRVPSDVGADEAAVGNATEGVREEDLPN